MLRILKRLLFRYLNTNIEIKALMLWYDIDEHYVKRYVETLPQNVINAIVNFYKKNKENESI